VSDCYTAGANPVSRIIPMVEIFMSAYISIPNLKFGSLSKFLISALQKIEGVDQIRELDFIEPKAEEKSETANLAPLVSLE
jgi:transcriptional regulator of aromatic amino acid metabolism